MEKSGTEKSPFSKLIHVGVVVRDIDKAIKYLSSLGVGASQPSSPPGPMTEALFRGKPVDWKLKVSFAKIGQSWLELLQPIEGASSLKEFLDSKGEGVHHIAFAVDDLDKEVAKLAKRGVRVLMSGRWAGGGFAYLETDAVGGIVIELLMQE